MPSVPPTRPCRSPAPVRSGVEALRIVMLATPSPLVPETVVFLLDDDGNGGLIHIVSGTSEHDAVVSVVECFARAAELHPSLTGMVVATMRPGCGVLPGDIDRWLDASSVAADHAVTLLEWYIVSPTGVECPRELLGEPERWWLASRRH